MISVPQLLYDIKQELGSFLTTEALNTTLLLKVINSWVKKVCLAANWKFNDYTYTLTTDWVQEEYDIPFWLKLYSIKVWWNSNEYTPVSFEEYMSDDNNDDYKKIWFKQDKLYTKEAITLTIVYRWLPTRLYLLEWNIDMPEITYDPLLAACVYYWFLQLKQYPRADKRLVDFQNDINRVRAMESDPFPRVSTRVGSSYSYNSR